MTVIEVHGRLTTGAEVDEFRSKWCDALAAGARCLVVNFAAVPYIDSGGIGCLIRLHASLTYNGGKLRIVQANETVMRALHAVQVDKLVECHPNEESARRSFFRSAASE